MHEGMRGTPFRGIVRADVPQAVRVRQLPDNFELADLEAGVKKNLLDRDSRLRRGIQGKEDRTKSPNADCAFGDKAFIGLELKALPGDT
jgi:hypothetical protein